MKARTLYRDPVHKVRVYRGQVGMWYADCTTCPKMLQHRDTGWFGQYTWADALDIALRHNSTSKWTRT